MENVMMDLTNWEEYLLLQLDGELSSAEEAELNAFLAAHPELDDEVKAYAATVLAPEEDVLFKGKEALYKPVPRRFNFRPVMWAAAAVLLIALGLKLVPEQNLPAVAVVPKKENVASVQPVVPPAQTVVVAVPPTVKMSVQTVAVVMNEQPQHLAEKGESSPKENPAPEEIPSVMVPLEVQPDRELTIANVLPADAQLQVVEAPMLAAVTPEKTARFAVQVPILNSIKEAAKGGLPTIQFAGEKLRGTETTVMLFDRKLFTIHF